jgi:hypothetical protein
MWLGRSLARAGRRPRAHPPPLVVAFQGCCRRCLAVSRIDWKICDTRTGTPASDGAIYCSCPYNGSQMDGAWVQVKCVDLRERAASRIVVKWRVVLRVVAVLDTVLVLAAGRM